MSAQSQTSNAGSSNERELELLRLIVLQDRTAFKELYLIYHRRLARFLMRITPQHELIEEVINDTMWTVWQKAASFRGASRVSTWIVGIAYRRALKALRRVGNAMNTSIDEAALVATQPVMDVEREWLQRSASLCLGLG